MSSSESLPHLIDSLINVEDVQKIVALQDSMLGKFEKTNEMLRTVSGLSSQRYDLLSAELVKHTKSIMILKKELDGIFKRIKHLKDLFGSQFPDEMAKVTSELGKVDDDSENEPEPVTYGDSCLINTTMETVREDVSSE